MVELFTWNRTDGYSIVKSEIKNKVEIPEMLPHKCATEVLAETEKFVEPIDNYSAGKRIRFVVKYVRVNNYFVMWFPERRSNLSGSFYCD